MRAHNLLVQGERFGRPNNIFTPKKKKKRKHYSLQSQSWLKQCESKQPTQDRARVALLPPNLTRWKIFPGSAKQQRQQIDFSGFSFFVMQLPQKPSQNGGLDPVQCAWPAAGRDATAHTPFGLGGTCQKTLSAAIGFRKSSTPAPSRFLRLSAFIFFLCEVIC